MSQNSQSHEQIFYRFRRALPTDFYDPADSMFEKVSAVYPEVAKEFKMNVDLTDLEIFLLAGILSGIREIIEKESGD